VKMSNKKSGKPFTILSENPKMDTSGMANKPVEFEMYEYEPMKMPLGQMVRKYSEKKGK
jgi:hypothetical protein